MGERILLVEDNVGFRRTFSRALGLALAAEQIEVTFVESGSLAEASGCGKADWTPRLST
jgi:CheY-like chemotaxis protein